MSFYPLRLSLLSGAPSRQTYKNIVAEYKKLGSDNIKIELPNTGSEKLLCDVSKEDMTHLATLLASADILITPNSTLSIDAACFDLPIINLAVDKQFARAFKFTHYSKLLTNKGVWVVESEKELLECVDQYLKNPALHCEGRKKIVKQQLGNYFGNAGVRTAEVLNGLSLK